MIVHKGRLLKKSFNRNLKLVLSMQASSWLSNIAFHLCAPSEVAVLFYSNLTRCSFLGQVVDLDLLLDSEHADFLKILLMPFIALC